jgi:hypothetical protein
MDLMEAHAKDRIRESSGLGYEVSLHSVVNCD